MATDRQKEAARQRLRAQQKEDARIKAWREERCQHMRGNNTSAIAWAMQSDNVTRGVCQHCNALFTPEHPRYAELLRIPVGMMDGVIYG